MGWLPRRDDLSCLHHDAAGSLPASHERPATMHQSACTTVEIPVTRAASTNQERKHSRETMVRKESD